MTTKFEIQKFDRTNSFALWQVKMRAILTQQGLQKALLGKEKMSDSLTAEQKEEIDDKALTAIQLCLSDEVLREVLDEKTAAGLWLKLESLYMTTLQQKWMEFSESSQVSRGRGKNKRTWKDIEDEVLVQCLQELSTDPQWKGENGFRNRYFSKLEKMIEEKLPGCGLKANPHIESRVKYFKQKYSAISEILSKTGIAWDDQQKVISCDKKWYDDWCKLHIEAKGLWGVPFPHLDALSEIFGKDRATGERVKTFTEAVQNMEREDLIPPPNDQVVNLNDDEEEFDMSFTQSQTRERQTPKSTKREKKSTIDDTSEVKERNEMREQFADFSKSVREVMSEMSSQFSIIANAISHEHKIVKKNMSKLVEEVLKVQDLSNSKKMKAINMLSAEPNKISAFFAIPSDLRGQFLLSLVNPNSDGSSRNI
uniref:Myb/SANT-like domain-containing protein n=1 Tax=Ananas comosus var. bracteatus TaxID=296719 RepID=A0A6V7PSW0_ANACO|nr:unnamed protein product [Ananas comosus var. bracteatus]